MQRQARGVIHMKVASIPAIGAAILAIVCVSLPAGAQPGKFSQAPASVTADWVNLGDRNEEWGGRYWVAVARRLADGRHYAFSGGTDGRNSVIVWDPPSEFWKVVKKGPGTRFGFPDPGAEFPYATDNGFAVWDNVADELWVNSVNPYIRGHPVAIYSPKTDAWRPATAPDLTGLDAQAVKLLENRHNSALASNDRWLVVYGGNATSNPSADLYVRDCLNKQWMRYPDHGLGAGKPGPMWFVQNQLRWSADLGKFVLYSKQRVFTLTPGTWTWQLMPTSGPAPVDGHSIGAAALDGLGVMAVFGGSSSDVYVLDLKSWTWSVRKANMPQRYLKRYDGLYWAERANDGIRLYQSHGGINGLGNAEVIKVWRLTMPVPASAPSPQPPTLKRE